MKHILVPVDRSDCSEAAVDCAAAVARLYEASITLLHAWEPLHELGLVASAATISTTEGQVPLVQHIAEEAEKTLVAHRARLADHPLEVRSKLVDGAPRQAIRDALATGEFDLVVLGTHGRTGLSHMMMGSVAEWVVRHASIPVMTAHAPAVAERTAAK